MTGKICFFNSTRAWGGGEKWHYDIAAQLYARHGRVFAVAGTGSELGSRLAAAGVPHYLVTLGNLSFLNPFTLIRLVRLFRRERPDVIIMNLPADLKAAGIAARLAGVGRIVYRRGSAIAVADSWLNRMLFRHVVDEVIVNSEETGRMLLAENSRLIFADRIHVIYNGIDWDAFDAQPAEPRYRPDGGGLVLGTVGRLVPQKGQDFLIRVAQRLKERGCRFSILIAGEGKLRETLLQQAAAAGVADCITLVGFVQDIPRFLNSLDIFLLPSHWEGFGYVLAEATYCRKPVVAFNVSSNPEIVTDGETGFLVDHGDLEAFVDRTVALMESPELRQRLGKRGREVAMERFSLQRTLAALEDFLERSASGVETA